MDAERVRVQLQWILGSSTFADAERGSRFLRFVVETALEGRTGEIKESVIGVKVLGRRTSFVFWSAAQYIEVDASNGKLVRWNVALPPVVGGEASGFAVTEKERVFVSLRGFSEPDNNVTHGLYELKAKTGTSVATLIPVDRTLTTHGRDGIPPDETFDRLWGADGEELVVHRHGDGWGISWAKVEASPTTPE